MNMINQSGLDKPFTTDVTDFDEYFTTGAQPFGQGNFSNNWQSNFTFNLPLMGFVDFDLGAVVPIDRIAIWNRSLETGNILVSQTLGGPMVNAGSFSLPNRLHLPLQLPARNRRAQCHPRGAILATGNHVGLRV